MALSLQEAVGLQERSTNLAGIALRRSPTTLNLLAEIAHLKETLHAKDAHIRTLETQLWAWRSQAMSELTARHNDSKLAYTREGELIRIIHQQMEALGQLQAKPGGQRRRWWARKP